MDLEARMANVVHNPIGNLWRRLHNSIMTSSGRLDKEEANDLRDHAVARAEVASATDDILPALAGSCEDLLMRAWA
jgi:hypothetical protein